MTDFKQAFNIVMGNEGGYSNNSSDKGGETYKGISKNNFPDWAGWNLITSKDNKVLQSNPELQDLVQSFYRKNFWNFDSLESQKMAIELFDTAVNMGVKTAGTFFQRVINIVSPHANLTVDGNIGKTTIDQFNSLDQKHQDVCFKLFNCLQGCKYISICENNPSQKIFITGWSTRITF